MSVTVVDDDIVVRINNLRGVIDELGYCPDC